VAYIFDMETDKKPGGSVEPVAFSGTVVRFEPDGFGLIEFDSPIGPQANSVGLVSSSTATSVLGTVTLKPGMKISGLAIPDPHDVAPVTKITSARQER
jgi:hypothetical protein